MKVSKVWISPATVATGTQSCRALGESTRNMLQNLLPKGGKAGTSFHPLWVELSPPPTQTSGPLLLAAEQVLQVSGKPSWGQEERCGSLSLEPAHRLGSTVVSVNLGPRTQSQYCAHSEFVLVSLVERPAIRLPSVWGQDCVLLSSQDQEQCFQYHWGWLNFCWINK